MGSQQLLIIVLGVIVVGIAVAAGIAIFGGNANQANKDAITHDLSLMASSAQAYYHKPSLLGGGGKSFTGITLNALGYEDTGGLHDNHHAQYQMLRIGTDMLFIIARSKVVASSYVVVRVMVGEIRYYVFGWGKSQTVEGA